MLSLSVITVIVAILTSLAVVFRRHKHIVNIVFSISLLSTSAVIFGDAMIMLQPGLLYEWKRFVFISEAVMVVAWLIFSLSFARTGYWQAASGFSRVFVYISPLISIFFFAVPIGNFFYAPDFQSEKVLFLGNAGYLFNLILLFYSILSIINLETTMRSSQGTDRWKIKFTIFGVGTLVAINIFYYSHALLYRSINMNFLPAKTGIILMAILIIGYSLFRHKTMDTELAVSRTVMYRSLSLIVVGGYLLGLGLIGEGMRYFGPKVGENITTFLVFAGAMLVIAIIFSERLRRRTVVFLNKNFFNQKYDYREQWLKFTQRISFKHSFDELLASIVEGFRDAIGAKGAAIWLKEKGGEEYRCVKALDMRAVQSGPGRELMAFLEKMKWVLDVRDRKCKKIVALSRVFIKETHASVIVPLLNMDDLAGFILLEGAPDEPAYNYEDYDLLKTLSRQAMSAILIARLSDELTEAREMEAVGRLSSFILHDLKNATSMLSLIVQNAEEHIDNPEFQRDAIKAVSNSSDKIKSIIGRLDTFPKKTSLDLAYSDLGSDVRKVIRQVNLNGHVKLSFHEQEAVMTRFDSEEMSKVVLNLIINAVEAIQSQGEVHVVVGMEDSMGFVKVSDTGCGMSDEFIEKRLFKPFQSTKKKGFGIGLYQCKSIVELHAGRLKVSSREGHGTEFIICLPIVSGN